MLNKNEAHWLHQVFPSLTEGLILTMYAHYEKGDTFFRSHDCLNYTDDERFDARRLWERWIVEDEVRW